MTTTIQERFLPDPARIPRCCLGARSDRVTKELDKMADNAKTVTENLEKLTKAMVSEEGKTLIKKFADVRAAYSKERGKLVEHLKAGRQKEAHEGLAVLIPHMQAYNNAIEDIHKFQEQHMKKAVEQAEENYAAPAGLSSPLPLQDSSLLLSSACCSPRALPVRSRMPLRSPNSCRRRSDGQNRCFFKR